MARKYYTLAVREGSVVAPWVPQFGDYSKEVVEQERLDWRDGSPGYKAKDLRVIVSGDTQAEISAAIAKLNNNGVVPEPVAPATEAEEMAAEYRDEVAAEREHNAVHLPNEGTVDVAPAAPAITPSEHKVLRSLYTNDYGDHGDCTWSWAVNDSTEPSGLAKTSVPGVIASLIKKGLAHSSQYSPTERTCGLTKAGQELAERVGPFAKVAP